MLLTGSILKQFLGVWALFAFMEKKEEKSHSNGDRVVFLSLFLENEGIKIVEVSCCVYA